MKKDMVVHPSIEDETIVKVVSGENEGEGVVIVARPLYPSKMVVMWDEEIAAYCGECVSVLKDTKIGTACSNPKAVNKQELFVWRNDCPFIQIREAKKV